MRLTVGQSRFWKLLWGKYGRSPSIALCRVPELEYASNLDVSGKVLDHCCGDGLFASLAWPDKVLAAGCDLDCNSVNRALSKKIYKQVDVCDVSNRLPYEDRSFNLIFNNSALEHIQNLDAALVEVARVLSPKGVFAFNVLNHRYFEWWPRDEKSMLDYRGWQPVYHAFNLEEWRERLGRAGLKLISVEGYFDKEAAEELARLDHSFSSIYIAHRLVKPFWWYAYIPFIMPLYWQQRLKNLSWKTEPDSGAGYFIRAVRINP